MYPLLLESPRVTAYGAALAAAVVLAWFTARRAARRTDVDPLHIDLLAPLLIAGGLLGAWAFGRLADATDAASVHGRSQIGALSAPVLVCVAYAFWRRVPLGRLGDAIAPALALGVAVGRIGCYLAGCCWGRVCTLEAVGVRFPAGSFAHHQHAVEGLIAPSASASLPVYPVQLFEAAAMSVLCVALWRLLRRPRVSGEVFLVFAMAYTLVRFALEPLRGDHAAVAASLSVWQVVSLGLLLIAVATLVLRRCLAEKLGLRVRPA